MIKEINGKEYDIKPSADLSGANLYRADLKGANLTGADLTRANLTRAYLRGAKLIRADLSKADLAHAYLVDANMAHAHLTGADLTRANLTRANFYGAKGIHLFYIAGMSSRDDLVYAVEHADMLMVKTGCFWGTYADFRARVIAKKSADSLYVKVGLGSIDLLNTFLYGEDKGS